MTSGSILPSTGPPPPEFRRVIVPEDLRPKLASEGVQQSSRQTPSVRSDVPNQNRPEENLASDALLQLAGEQEARGIGTSQTNRPFVGNQAPPSANLGGPSAVALQVQEASRTPSTSVDAEEQKLVGELTDEEKAIVEDLKERDREVRAHENAHAAAGGGYAGTPTFEFTRGPDGIQYAIGGQVQIDVSEVSGDPEATLAKMEVVRRADLAPARPSGQDRAVAAQADAQAREARAEIAEQQKDERLGLTEEAVGVTGQAALIERAEGNEGSPTNIGDFSGDTVGESQQNASDVGVITGGSPKPQSTSIDLLV